MTAASGFVEITVREAGGGTRCSTASLVAAAAVLSTFSEANELNMVELTMGCFFLQKTS